MRVLFVSTWTKLSGPFKIINIIISEVLLKTTAVGENQSLFGFLTNPPDCLSVCINQNHQITTRYCSTLLT